MKKLNKKDYNPARKQLALTSGQIIRNLRTLKSWTQDELAKRSGIGPTNISLLENDRVDLGKHRAQAIAKALGVHPAILMFPDLEKQLGKSAA